MNTLDALLAGIVADPLEETRWLVLADWLDENDDPRRAELLRLHRRLLGTCCEPDAHPERADWQARVTELLVAGVRPCVPQHTLALPGGVPLVGSFVPPGSFLMGSTESDDEHPIHRQTVSDGFFLGVYPVTQAQWRAVYGTDWSHFKGPNRPVEQVSSNHCQVFCANLTSHLGGSATVRVPTEVEWEYACRAGTRTHYHFGDVPSADLANYDGSHTWNGSAKGENRKETTDVGSFPPNPWGLYDLHGNVSEWCEIQNASPDCSTRYPRGGTWAGGPRGCRAA
jgi:uncharacterized protein (TIGR02996 family)